MSARGTAQSGTGAATEAGNSKTLENLARVGLLAYGVVHLLVAWLAVQLAWFGGGGKSADQSGAMSTLADSPVGKPLLWVIAVGLIALAGWQAAEVLRWRGQWSASGSVSNKARAKALQKSGKALGKTVVYVVLAVLAIKFATGSGKSSSQQQQKTTAGVFGWPAGRWLVGAVGLVLIGVGVYHVYKGVSKRFLKEIDTSDASASALRLVTRLGQVGFPGKGVALAGVGALLLWAAVTFDPSKARGLDGAMHAILDLPFGQVLLPVVALGIAAFGAYLFVRARYPERT
jgi:Domain of Unknown Function (DUF1206)